MGLVDLPVHVLKRSETIQALVCTKFSQDAILGMDAIQKLHIALNPIHHSYFYVSRMLHCRCSYLDSQSDRDGPAQELSAL